MPFSVYKVFSIADVYDRLPEEAKSYVDQVVHDRKGVGMQIDATDDFHADIMKTMKDMAARQGIKVNEGGNGAYYNFVKDEITIPHLRHGQSRRLERLGVYLDGGICQHPGA